MPRPKNIDRNTVKSVRLEVRLTPLQKDLFDQKAKARNLNLTELISMAVASL